MSTNKKHLIVLVENNTGVLARLSSLFCQRGFNIDSLNVSATDNPAISRFTIVTEGDEHTFLQIIKQTGKLIETKMVFPVEPSFGILRELLLVKLDAKDADTVNAINELAAKNDVKIADKSVDSIVLEMADSPEKIDLFIDRLKPFTVLEMCRTGVTAMERGRVSYTLPD